MNLSLLIINENECAQWGTLESLSISPQDSVPAVAPRSCGGASPSRCSAGPLWRAVQRAFASAGCSGSATRPETDEPLAASPPGWSGAAAAERSEDRVVLRNNTANVVTFREAFAYLLQSHLGSHFPKLLLGLSSLGH